VLPQNIEKRSDLMVICWIFQTVEKKRVKEIANNPDTEYKLLKENHKKDKLIEFLELELRKND